MQRLVRWFVVVGGVVGVLFAVFTPPFASPDEATHFFRSYQLSEGHVFADQHGARVGGMLPASVEHDVHLVDVPGPVPGWSTIRKVLGNPTGGRRVFTDFQNTALYPPLTYAPQTVAIAVGRTVGLSNLALMYLARLADLAVFLALAAYAAVRFPRSPWLVIGVALLPSTLFLAGSVSPDALTIGLCAVMLAEAARADRPYVVLALGVALGLAKPPYFLVSLVALAVWFLRGRRGWQLPAAAGTCCALAVAWSRWADHIFVPYRPIIDRHLDVRPAAQRAHLLHHPLHFAGAVASTAARDWHWWLGQVLAPFGRGIDASPPVAVAAAGFLVLVLVLAPRRPLDQRVALALVGFALVTVLATIVAVYLYSNAVGAQHVRLVFGRYLLPVLPALLVAVPRVWRPRNQARIDAGLLGLAAVIGVAGLLTVV